MRFHLLTLLLSTGTLLGSAHADTWIIDDGGGAGVDFTDIQSAINVASHGDILIVNPGTYAGFTLNLGLTILGSEASNTSVVTSASTIASVNGNRRAVLTGLRMEGLGVSSNTGHVILDSLELVPNGLAPATLVVSNSNDVRLYQCTVEGLTDTPFNDNTHALKADNSRLEVINSDLVGGAGFDTDCWSDGGHGGSGVWASGASLVAVFDSRLTGGDGGDTGLPDIFCEWSDPIGGDGGHGLLLQGGSVAVLAGGADDLLDHGREGYSECWPICFDGDVGEGLALEGASIAEYSGLTISSIKATGGSIATESSPSDPYLERYGTLKAGRQQTFWINGAPGDQVIFYIGRSPSITIDSTQTMDDLVSHERAYSLGAIDGTGRKKFLFTIPSWFPEAFNFYVQAATIDGTGQRTLTNSMPIVLRYLP